jgi:Na+/glutamate symporter
MGDDSEDGNKRDSKRDNNFNTDNMPSGPSLSLKMRIAQMWVQAPAQLIAIIVGILLFIGGIVFCLVWFLWHIPHENEEYNAGTVQPGGPGHALQIFSTGVTHFLHLRQHA